MLVFELSTLTWCFLELDEPGHGLHGHGAVEHPGRPGELIVFGGRGPDAWDGELRTIDVGRAAEHAGKQSARTIARGAGNRGDHLRSGSFEAHLDATIKVVNKLKWSRVDRKSRLTPDARYGQIFAAWDPRFHLAIHPNPGSEKRKKKAAREAAEGRQSKLLGGAMAGLGGEEKKAERELISGPHGALPPGTVCNESCLLLFGGSKLSQASGPPNADGRPSATGYASGELWLFDVGFEDQNEAAERERAAMLAMAARAAEGGGAPGAPGAGAGAGARGSRASAASRSRHGSRSGDRRSAHPRGSRASRDTVPQDDDDGTLRTAESRGMRPPPSPERVRGQLGSPTRSGMTIAAFEQNIRRSETTLGLLAPRDAAYAGAKLQLEQSRKLLNRVRSKEGLPHGYGKMKNMLLMTRHDHRTSKISKDHQHDKDYLRSARESGAVLGQIDGGMGSRPQSAPAGGARSKEVGESQSALFEKWAERTLDSMDKGASIYDARRKFQLQLAGAQARGRHGDVGYGADVPAGSSLYEPNMLRPPRWTGPMVGHSFQGAGGGPVPTARPRTAA